MALFSLRVRCKATTESENIGSLWIIVANSRSEAQAFVDGEAFCRAGVFESVSVKRVRKGHFHPERAD